MRGSNGGPAFARPATVFDMDQVAPGVDQGGATGMTLRDYLAAHAPAVPDWYDPPGPHVPGPSPSPPKQLAAAWREFVREQRAETFPAFVHAWHPGEPALVQAAADYLTAREVWQQRQSDALVLGLAGRLVRWRWFYADLMIEHRDTPPE